MFDLDWSDWQPQTAVWLGKLNHAVFQIFDTELKDQEREVCFIDIAYDEIPDRYYKESEVSLCGCLCVDAH